MQDSGALGGLLARPPKTSLVLTLEEGEQVRVAFSDWEMRGQPRGLQMHVQP